MNISSLLTNPTTEVIIEVYIANQIFSAFVQSLPAPEKVGNNVFYTIIYNFLSILSADFKSFQKTLPAPQGQFNTIFPSGMVTTSKSIIAEGIPTKRDPLND